MATVEWFRNTEWSDAIAAEFESKLKRARRKEQYLRIQASTLSSAFPSVAHVLLDRYFLLADDFDHAQAHVDRAHAFAVEGKIGDAVASYERALLREMAFPKLLTNAYLDLPFLIATRTIVEHFDRAIEVLDQNRGRLMFPVDHFKWNASKALIAKSRGNADAARWSEAALTAESQGSSGFRNHPKLGLVEASLSQLSDQLREMCLPNPPFQRTAPRPLN